MQSSFALRYRTGGRGEAIIGWQQCNAFCIQEGVQGGLFFVYVQPSLQFKRMEDAQDYVKSLGFPIPVACGSLDFDGKSLTITQTAFSDGILEVIHRLAEEPEVLEKYGACMIVTGCGDRIGRLDSFS